MPGTHTTHPATPPSMPPVTDAHRQAAFASLRLRCCATLAEAMADPLRARVVEARAHQLRTREWLATQAMAVTTPVRRLDPRTGLWCTQVARTGWAGDAGRLI